jgi:hypothetical protein
MGDSEAWTAMSRFVLIDHSLKGVGGHHFEYATHVLSAARRQGFTPVLATNRRFRPSASLLAECRVFPVFRHTTYGADTIFNSGRSREHRGLLRRGASLFRGMTRSWRRAAREGSFYRGLRRLFGQIGVAPGDHIFIPTLSELDLAGMARFLSSDERARDAQWHLQFHYNIFDGREPDFADQEDRLKALRAVFAEAWSSVGQYRVRCYNTTVQLTAQYDRLGVVKFETLPYPVNPALHARRERRSEGGPLRVTVAGAIRAEKGSSELAEVLRGGWRELFQPGRVQLVVQSNKSWFRLPLPENAEGASVHRPVERNVGETIRLPQVAGTCEPVVYAPHPLAPEAYVDLLRRADIGLLLYDSERYYSRCSGVLVELLSLGVPVIVAAGCWMADQIAPAIGEHIRRAVELLPTVSTHEMGGAETVIGAPDEAAELVLSVRWEGTACPGVYARFDVVCENAAGESLNTHSIIVGRVKDEEVSPAMTHVPPGSRRIRIACKNAYHGAPLPAKSIEARLLNTRGVAGGSYPLGAVGLIAADVAGVGYLLKDMVDHWPHYRDTAAAFAPQWRSWHNADRIVSLLTASPPSRSLEDISRAA